jgi:hypothetical protein
MRDVVGRDGVTAETLVAGVLPATSEISLDRLYKNDYVGREEGKLTRNQDHQACTWWQSRLRS